MRSVQWALMELPDCWSPLNREVLLFPLFCALKPLPPPTPPQPSRIPNQQCIISSFIKAIRCSKSLQCISGWWFHFFSVWSQILFLLPYALKACNNSPEVYCLSHLIAVIKLPYFWRKKEGWRDRYIYIFIYILWIYRYMYYLYNLMPLKVVAKVWLELKYYHVKLYPLLISFDLIF